MLDLYTSVVFITVFTLVIAAVDVMTNHLVSKKNKREIITICLLTGIAVLCEWFGVKANSLSASLIWLRKCVKFIEFCVAPAIGFAAAIAYGHVKKRNV